MKHLIFVIIYLTSSIALCQNIQPEDCDNVGEINWPVYEKYLQDIDNGKTFATIREYDGNIWSVTPKISGYKYVLDKLYLRWILTDSSIPYDARVTGMMGSELIRTEASECVIAIYPDSIMSQYDENMLIVNIERENKGSFNWGASYVLKPMENKKRNKVLLELEMCKDVECQLDKLLKRELYIDALSLLEEATKQQSNKDFLNRKYWEIVTFINQ